MNLDLVKELDENARNGLAFAPQYIPHHLSYLAAREIERLRGLAVREVDFPVLDGILTEKLFAGARIAYQDYEWHLFAKDGNGIAHGKTISKMIENLIWAEG